MYRHITKMKPFCLFLVLIAIVLTGLGCGFLRNNAGSEPIRIIVVGDSTVQNYPKNDSKCGWGQVIGLYFNDSVEIVNLAKSGRSTKTFINEGRWADALSHKGDYLFIQFGHNDSHAKERPESTDADGDYMEYLRVYAGSAREDGVQPVFITPMHRGTFNIDGTLRDNLKPYADAMKSVAVENDVPVIDLHTASGRILEPLGKDGVGSLFCSPKDRSHFSEKGAHIMAGLIIKALPGNVPDLKPYIRNNYR